MRRRLDVAAAILVAAVAVGERLGLSPQVFQAPAAADIATLVAVGVLLAGRLALPHVTVWAFLAVLAVEAALLSPPLAYRSMLVAVLLFGYAAGSRLTGRALAGWALGYVAVIEVATLRFEDALAADFLFYPAIGLGAFAAGRAAFNRTRLVEELAATARQIEDRGEAASRRAVAEERRRIAHELHDVVAHAISVMVVQAGGGRRILAADPVRATDAAAQVERTGREALLEMRRLLAVLRDPDAPAEREPNPTLDGLPTLIDRLAADGLPVTLALTGEPRPVTAGLGLGAYRVVQDALEDAARTAPGAPTAVRVHWADDALELRISDERPDVADADGAEHGLLGARERVAVYGGTLDSRPLPGGGHEVVARIPLDPAVDPTITPETTGGAA